MKQISITEFKKKNKKKENKRELKKRLSMKYGGYHGYLHSKQWYKKRNRIMKLFDGKCFDCTGEANEVHHITYKNLYFENDEDLIPLCNKCHEKRHSG